MELPLVSTSVFLLLLLLSSPSSALLSPDGINYEVQALMMVKDMLNDPHDVLRYWDKLSVDPCLWNFVTCSPENSVTGLVAPSQNLSGMLSPSIGNLTNLETIILQNNNIIGPIPAEIGKLAKLKALDLSVNHFHDEIPSSIGHLESLVYLRLNNNSLSGPIPPALASLSHLFFLDFSYNNLSGPIPTTSARTFNMVGNPLFGAENKEQDLLYGTEPTPMSSYLNRSQV